MAIKLISEWTRYTFSPLRNPQNEETVIDNTFKVSMRGILGTGSVALISAIFHRYITPETWKNDVYEIFFESSLASFATCAVVASYIFYRTRCGVEKKTLNDELYLYGRNLMFVSAPVVLPIVVLGCLKKPPFFPIARSLFFPVGFSSMTLNLLWLYHNRQIEQRSQPEQAT